MLFLQLLSYYVKTFNAKQFVVSIQTRMPVMKIDKNWHSKKLLVEGRFYSKTNRLRRFFLILTDIFIRQSIYRRSRLYFILTRRSENRLRINQKNTIHFSNGVSREKKNIFTWQFKIWIQRRSLIINEIMILLFSILKSSDRFSYKNLWLSGKKSSPQWTENDPWFQKVDLSQTLIQIDDC